MSHTRLLTSAAIIALALVVSFAFSVPHTRDIVPTTGESTEVPRVPAVSVRDSFKKGTHTITGSIEATNACTTVVADAAFLDAATDTAHILLALSLSEDSGTCLQLPARMNFSATVTAPANVPIVTTVNGSTTTAAGL